MPSSSSSSPGLSFLVNENYKDYKIIEAPDSIFYIPDFITADEESALQRSVDASPRPKWTTLSNRRLQNWGGLPHPKGMVTEPIPDWLSSYCDRVSQLGVFGDDVVDGDGEVKRLANHVLVNEYLSGQGILPHEDGPLYYPTVTTISLGSHTVLDFYRKNVETDEESTLKERFVTSVLVQPRSLLILQNSAYTHHLHGIQEVSKDVLTEAICCNWRQTRDGNSVGSDERNLSSPRTYKNEDVALSEEGDAIDHAIEMERARRISLTIRYVPKVIKAKLLFGKKKR